MSEKKFTPESAVEVRGVVSLATLPEQRFHLEIEQPSKLSPTDLVLAQATDEEMELIASTMALLGYSA